MHQRDEDGNGKCTLANANLDPDQWDLRHKIFGYPESQLLRFLGSFDQFMSKIAKNG